jgi:hypothetical protein
MIAATTKGHPAKIATQPKSLKSKSQSALVHSIHHVFAVHLSGRGLTLERYQPRVEYAYSNQLELAFGSQDSVGRDVLRRLGQERGLWTGRRRRGYPTFFLICFVCLSWERREIL